MLFCIAISYELLNLVNALSGVFFLVLSIVIILSSCKFLIMFVVKFLRAHGGCLGIGSRRRTWESAISLVESITGR